MAKRSLLSERPSYLGSEFLTAVNGPEIGSQHASRNVGTYFSPPPQYAASFFGKRWASDNTGELLRKIYREVLYNRALSI